MDSIFTVQNAVTLLSLSFMEIVLGIDNIVFLSIVTAKLPPATRNKTRRVGLILALGMRILLLFAISWIMKLTKPLFHIFGLDVTGHDLILFGGGLFLIVKSCIEIYEKVQNTHEEGSTSPVSSAVDVGEKGASQTSILFQIMVLDIVFSLDSVITAVGMASHIEVMVCAMLVAVLVMIIFAGRVGDFINRHPSTKILALSFLVLIGTMLIMEGLGLHLERIAIYVAMSFSLVVELLNIQMRKNQIKKMDLISNLNETTSSEVKPPLESRLR